MYERYVMNRDRLLRQIKTSYETTAQKISVVERDMQTIQTKLERVEESYILGRISQAKADHLRQQLYEDRARKERRKEELIDLYIRKESQRKSLLLDTIDENLLTHEDKSEIIRQVVEIITIEKPNPTYSVIKIYNRINSLVYVYEVHCWNHTWTLLRESTTRKDPHIPIKSNPNIRKTISA